MPNSNLEVEEPLNVGASLATFAQNSAQKSAKNGENSSQNPAKNGADFTANPRENPRQNPAQTPRQNPAPTPPKSPPNPSNFTRKRHALYAVITLFALVIPFVRIDGNHFFLLSFDHKALHLFFVRFDMQEFYMLPFLLILFFVALVTMTTIGGRVWCGWGCPQTIFRVVFRDLIQTRLLGLFNPANRQKRLGTRGKFALSVLLWLPCALLAAANFLWFFMPPEEFFGYVANAGEHRLAVGIWLCVAAFIVFDVCFLAERFCVYVCPYARIQSVMFDNETMQVIYNVGRGGVRGTGANVGAAGGANLNVAGAGANSNLGEGAGINSNLDAAAGVANIAANAAGTKSHAAHHDRNGECINCRACVKICPTHIDIRNGTQLDCINCLECVDACERVMQPRGAAGLIEWNSANAVLRGTRVRLLRAKTLISALVLAACVAGLFVAGGNKQSVLLNINRNTELYHLRAADGADFGAGFGAGVGANFGVKNGGAGAAAAGAAGQTNAPNSNLSDGAGRDAGLDAQSSAANSNLPATRGGIAGSGVVVENSYVFFLQNVGAAAHEFELTLSDERVKIVRPKGLVRVGAKSKRKFVVVLRTTEMLANATQNTPLPLTLTLRAKDAPEVATQREIVFVFPKASEIDVSKIR